MAQNRFKFQSFAQRIAKIKIDVVRQIGEERKQIPDEEQDTFFREALAKWTELNCTQDFVNFNREVKGLVQNLKQLLFHKDEVLNIISKHIKILKSNCLDALLDLLAQLARDLQYEIYPHFEVIFKILTKLLYSHDAAIIENTFVCLAYIFKYLWRYMLDDAPKIYGYYKSLLTASQKPHIRQFAAESISFLIRKLKSKSSFLDVVFQSCVMDPQLTDGVGILLFETIKGVNHMFHSCLINVLPLALGKLTTQQAASAHEFSNEVFDCLLVVMKAARKYTTKDNCDVLCDCLISQIESSITNKEDEDAEGNTLSHGVDGLKISYLIKLVTCLVEWKSGLLVGKCGTNIWKVLNRLLKIENSSLYHGALLELFAVLVQTETFNIPAKDIYGMLELIFAKTEGFSKLSNFIQHCKSWSSFEEFVMPCFVSFVEKSLLAEKNFASEKSHKLIRLLTGQIASREDYFIGSFQCDGATDKTLYMPRITKADERKDGCRTVADVLITTINKLVGQQESKEVSSDSISLIWCCVVCLPNIRPLDGDKAMQSLHQLLQQLLIQQEGENQNGSAVLFLISQAVRSFLTVKSSSKGQPCVDLNSEEMLSLIRHHPTNIHILQAFECFLNSRKTETSTSSSDKFEEVFVILKDNLSSNLSSVRHLTLLIFSSLFSSSKELDLKRLTIESCLNAEQIPATFDRYMERLLHLRKLVFKSFENVENQKVVNDVIVRYLVGNLRINLRPMWSPVMDIIKTHANEKNGKEFWSVFKDSFFAAFETTGTDIDEDNVLSADHLVFRYISAAYERNSLNRPDNNNFRLLLCQAMEKFPNMAESRSRDIIPVFFNFLSKEYGRFDDTFSPSQDITVSKVDDAAEILAEKDNEEQPETELEPESKKRNNRKHESNRKMKILGAFLKLFSQFKNPKALFKEQKLYETYLELLSHRENEIQQLAYYCLKTYKFAYLKPYEEHFEKLFQDNTFRDELTLFAAGEENQLIKAEHRIEVMRILIRLLYGKLQRRSGLGVSGKSSQSARRNIIINFIGSCPAEDISTFVQLITDPFTGKGEDSSESVAIDLHHVIPLRKQIGFLNMLQTILTRLSSSIQPHVDFLLNTLLDVLSTCQECLKERSEITSSFVGQLKSIRQLCLARIVDFFEILQDVDYVQYIERIFEHAVTPQVSRLKQESQQHPSPLLKLLHCWSKSRKYFNLLGKVVDYEPAESSTTKVQEITAENDAKVDETMGQQEVIMTDKVNGEEIEEGGSKQQTPLYHIFSILSVKDKSAAVVKIVMTIAENLLQMKNDDEGKMMETDDDSNYKKIALEMITQHIDLLLAHLSDSIRCKKSTDSEKRQKDEAFQTELSVLAHISSFAKDPTQCQTIVSILFPTLKSAMSEKDQTNTLLTIKNLIHNCNSTKNFAAEMISLFMKLKSRSARNLLCDIFQILVENDATLGSTSEIIRDLNSWDVKWLDEPNFEKRLKAFSSFTVMLKSSELTVKQIRPILANCLYFSVSSQDMSLRDASISCLCHVLDFVKNNEKNGFEELIQGLLMPVVKDAIRSKNEIVRAEYVGLLANIVRSFEESSIADMRILTAEDLEMDFFENIKHIQFHRRIRAVRQLFQSATEGKLKQNSLYTFLLPLITHFIFDVNSSKDHNLVSETISAVGAIMGCMSWQRYSHVLRSYLKLLPKEKTKTKLIIRVIVAIMDAFHFDLSILTSEDVKQDNIQLSQQNEPKTENPSKKEDSKESEAEDDMEAEDDKEAEDNKEAEEVEDAEEDDSKNEMIDVEHKDEKETSLSSARKIHKTIVDTILPQLHKSLIKKSFVEDYHRKSHNKEVDEAAILRVPVALAIVKLLQQLPKATLHGQLPGLLLRVCQTLKSRARDVRDTARETLVHIASSLGPGYFSFVLREMRSVLQRGYQLHVLSFTLKAILDELIEQFKPGDLDSSLKNMIEVFMQDIFGNVAEEKEVAGITGKLHEAKSTKSYDSFEIIAKFATPSSFEKIVRSLRELLETTHTHKVSNKAKEVLRRVSLGFQNNSSLTVQTLLVYVHQLLAGMRSYLLANNSKDTKRDENSDRSQSRDDIYLVKKEPGRGNKIVEHSKQANLHLIAEFGLQLLHTSLKNQRLLPSNKEHCAMLDPYVEVLINCLKSKYNRVVILAAKSIALFMRFPLPSLEANAKSLAATLFKLLKNYARVGAGTGDNYELVLSSFKAMTVIIRDNKKYQVTNDQLRILLTFVEEDVHDYTRQATAFPLLKAILSRKLNVTEIVEVMKKVAELSITSESNSVQLQCRQLMLQYMLDYPLGKKTDKHLEFYLSHLEYELENGRQSALEMLAMIFKNFPQKKLQDYAGFFFVPLVMRFVNEESPLCRKLTTAVVKTLLEKLETEKRTELFTLTSEWFQQEKVSLKRLAIQAIGIFAEVEENAFEKRISTLLPEIEEVIKPSLHNDDLDEDDDTDEIKARDQFLFNTLTALKKILQHCNVMRKMQFQDNMNGIWGSVKVHLQHPHTWVRLVSCQLFGQLFASWQPTDLIKTCKQDDGKKFYLSENLPFKVKGLCTDLYEQLKSDKIGQELGDQITKNLVYLTKVIALISKDDAEICKEDQDRENEATTENETEVEKVDDKEKPPTLHWLLNKMSYLASYEASQEQRSHIKRMCIFRWLAAVSLHLGNEGIELFIIEILRPLHRELISSSSDTELHKLAQEVIDLIKEVIGKELFAEKYSKLQRKVSEKKEKRKRQNAEEAVIDPAKFAQKKQKKNLAKRDQRKRKLMEKKPSLMKISKKQKVTSGADDL